MPNNTSTIWDRSDISFINADHSERTSGEHFNLYSFSPKLLQTSNIYNNSGKKKKKRVRKNNNFNVKKVYVNGTSIIILVQK